MLKPSKVSLGVVMAVCAVIPAWADDLALCLDNHVDACTRLITLGISTNATAPIFSSIEGLPTE